MDKYPLPLILLVKTKDGDDAGYKALSRLSLLSQESKLEIDFQIHAVIDLVGNEPAPGTIFPYFMVKRGCKTPPGSHDFDLDMG